MDTLDLLISKFKEVKEELAKGKGDVCGNCNLNKVTSDTSKMCDPCRISTAQAKLKARGTPVAAPAAVPPKKRLAKSEELEKTKSMVSQMKGAGHASLQSPHDMSRANTFQNALAGEFQPRHGAFERKPVATASVPTSAPAKKLTGLDRIKAVSSQPIIKADLLKQKTADKKFSNESFGKTINSSYGPTPNGSLAMSCGEKLSLNKGGQWGLQPSKAGKVAKDETGMPKGTVAKAEDEKGRCTNCGSKACVGDCKMDHVGEAMRANDKHNEGFKNKIKGLCPKCHAKKCQCGKEGILVDKIDGSGTNSGSL